MLVCIFKNLQENSFYKAIKWFFSSPLYILLIGAIAVYSCYFGTIELTAYTYCILGCILPVLFFDDLRMCIAPIFFAYVTTSKLSNDYKTDISLFTNPNVKELIITFGIIISICFIVRMIFDLIVNHKRIHLPRLLISLIILGVTFIIGGINTDFYSTQTRNFGIVLALFLIIPYLIIIITVDFKTLSLDYFAYLLLILGLTVSIETFLIFKEIGLDTITTNPNFRNEIYTGWGINNNIGGEILLGIASAGYLAIKKHGGFIYLPIMFINIFAIILTTSRASIILSIILLIVTITLVLVLSEGYKRIVNLIVLIAMMLLGLYLFTKYEEKVSPYILYVLKSFARDDLNDISSNRIEIWKSGINQFKEYKLFGVGFFELDKTIFESTYLQTSFMPSRYHNTIIQLLACTGIVGISAYLINRISVTVHVFIKPDIEKLFITLGILSITLASLLDCHFFNLGPTMQYSVLLSLYEGIDIYKKNKRVLEDRI